MPAPRLSNVILRVADLERALAFWRDRVGLPVKGAGGELAFLDAGGVAVALHAVPSPAEAEAGGGLAALTELVLEVPDVQAAHAELAARGVPFRTPPRAVTGDGARELWACDFRDPDGHLVSVTGWVAKGREG
jgi:catechol 2,3-dioxygenase-like lactoylglutathione lyase family enzyme